MCVSETAVAGSLLNMRQDEVQAGWLRLHCGRNQPPTAPEPSGLHPAVAAGSQCRQTRQCSLSSHIFRVCCVLLYAFIAFIKADLRLTQEQTLKRFVTGTNPERVTFISTGSSQKTERHSHKWGLVVAPVRASTGATSVTIFNSAFLCSVMGSQWR